MKLAAKLLGIFSLLLLLSCNDSAPKQKTAEEIKQELLIKEQSTPLTYISADATISENKVLVQKPDLFHHSKYETDGWIINGQIKNTATIAKFKDAVVKVIFYSQTKSEITSQSFVIYKFFGPNSNIPFQLKVNPPAAMANFGIEVTNATPVY